MADMMSVREASELWGIFDTRITMLCREGKIEGAVKDGKSWYIPVNTPKPIDKRFKKIQKHVPDNVKLPLPIGVSDYRIASTEYYYVDKTLMIKEFIDERPIVSLFTRPRRFGKTLNMDMLRTFFEKTHEDTSVYFKDKLIWSCGEKYREYQGKYPVIFITFKDVKFGTWSETLSMIGGLISDEFSRHSELKESNKCSIKEKKIYDDIVNRKVNSTELTSAFAVLSKMLFEHYDIAPIIIIDEYDIPIQQGHMAGFYDEVIAFMRNLFSGGLKDNKYLSYGFLTGILRVAKESIFSGLNNLKINSVLDKKYSNYFGFTREEVKNMAEYYDSRDKFEEICKWYNGYIFGNTEIFNPWSVINYFSNECIPRAFWQATGSNEIIGEILENADEDIYSRLKKLLQGEKFVTYIDTGVIYPQIRSNPSSIYSFLLVAGYLRADKSEISFNGDFMCEVSLPNREIVSVYNKEILQKLDNVIPQSSSVAIQEAMYSNDTIELKKQLRKLLLRSVSNFDTVGENFYHGFVLGLCAIMDNRYYVTSNRESGEGRYDIQIMPKDKKNPGIIIEIKAGKRQTEEELIELSRKALQQINNRKYDIDMKEKGITDILKYGVAFSGKNVEICSE